VVYCGEKKEGRKEGRGRTRKGKEERGVCLDMKR